MLRNYQAARELERVCNLSAFNVQGATRRGSRWAVRDAETKERLSYRYADREEARAALRNFEHTGRVLEVYRTSQSLVTMRGSA